MLHTDTQNIKMVFCQESTSIVSRVSCGCMRHKDGTNTSNKDVVQMQEACTEMVLVQTSSRFQHLHTLFHPQEYSLPVSSATDV